MFLMFTMLVASVFTGTSVHSRVLNEDLFDLRLQYISNIFAEDDMTPEFTEQLDRHDHSTDVRRRKDSAETDRYGPPINARKVTIKPVAVKTGSRTVERSVSEANAPQPIQKADERPSRNIVHDTEDVADREDHVTQYIADLNVNTDSEITSLQANEAENERGETVGGEVKEDTFFSFLTGLEKPVEVEGVWSHPNHVEDYSNEVPKIPEQASNAIIDVDYKA